MSNFRIFDSFWLPFPILLVLVGQAPGQSDSEQLRRREDLWNQCRDIWYEGKEDWPLAEKLEFYDSFSADRKLSAKQKDCILRIGNQLLDSRNSSRRGCARWLGDMGHAYCISPLLAVLRDEAEDEGLRAECVHSLSRIPDKRVADPIIDALADPQADVAGAAKEQLDKMFKFVGGMEPTKLPHEGIGHGIGWRSDDLDWRREIQAKYRAWWEKNRDRIQLDRRSTGWH
ncbi:MAG: HEAT repeat domain-containing protein [Planctomycetota bacterium]